VPVGSSTHDFHYARERKAYIVSGDLSKPLIISQCAKPSFVNSLSLWERVGLRAGLRA